jgi:succinyl-CoA:acetate CoA-transferase
VDLAVVEACAIREDGGIVPTTAVGCAQTYVRQARRVIVEVNLSQPAALEGLHDLYAVEDPPHRRPIPLMDAGERIGTTYIPCDPEKIAAVVLTQAAEKPRPLAPADDASRAIAGRIVALLRSEREAGRLSPEEVPLQSGVGSVANAVLQGLLDSDFRHLRFYSEVMQDGILDLMDAGKADFCSATSLSLSEPAWPGCWEIWTATGAGSCCGTPRSATARRSSAAWGSSP